MAIINFDFSSTVSGQFDDVDFYAGKNEIELVAGKYAFSGRIPQGGFLNIAIDVFGDNGQQIDVAYTCIDEFSKKHEDPDNPSIVTDSIKTNRSHRIELRIPF